MLGATARKSDTLIFLGIVAMGIYMAHDSFSSLTAGNIDETDRYAWSENAGWLDFGADQSEIRITDTALSGYAYGENVGWISLGCDNDDSCTVADYGVANDGDGNLSGYAYGENVGWIDFSPLGSGVVINSAGEFTGYAYGENVGWISFNCSNDDSCATVDYKLTTDYRPRDSRPACNNGRDDDADGKADYPTDPGCSGLEDNNETDTGGSVMVAPPRPSLKNVSIGTEAGIIAITGLPSSVIQFAVSPFPDFRDASWEKIAEMDGILGEYRGEGKLYFKFRTAQGAVSDVVAYAKEADADLRDGDIVKTADNPDVFIIKYKNGKRYKRLILSPRVFQSYGHLRWENIKTVSQARLDSFTSSNLVKETENTVIYGLAPDGDTGQRRPWDISSAYDVDSIYEINKVDRDSYRLVR